MAESPDFEPVKQNKKLLLLADQVEMIVRIAAVVLPLCFAFVKLTFDDVVSVLSSADKDVILRIAITIYYLSWAVGPISDSRAQRTAYFEPPWHGSLTRWGALFIGCLVLMFFVLLLAESERQLAAALSIIWVLDFSGIVYMRKGLSEPLSRSTRMLLDSEENYDSELMLRTVSASIIGQWKNRRFLVGGAILVVLNCAAWMGFGTLPILLPERGGVTVTISAMLILLFVVTVEGWMWIARINRSAVLSVLRTMSKDYRLVRR